MPTNRSVELAVREELLAPRVEQQPYAGPGDLHALRDEAGQAESAARSSGSEWKLPRREYARMQLGGDRRHAMRRAHVGLRASRRA